jgi:hypothetical protein
MERICKNCKHWKSLGKFFDHLKIYVEYGDCRLFETYPGNDKSDRVIASSDFFFIAVTGENFGCIHFEPKEDKENEEKK